MKYKDLWEDHGDFFKMVIGVLITVNSLIGLLALTVWLCITGHVVAGVLILLNGGTILLTTLIKVVGMI